MERIAIIGLGLMGGSLGLALKKRHVPCVVTASSRSPKNRHLAVARGAVDHVFERPLDAARDATVVVICTPVLAIPAMAEAVASAVRPGAVITDVGSTKAWLMAELPKRLVGADAVFVGSHPICGGEQTGMDAAREDLYEGAMVAITAPKTPTNAAAEVQRISSLWKSVGANFQLLEASEHDRIVARTSHLPHLAASLLSTTVGRSVTEKLADFCGSGFRDTTRVAAGDAEIWHDILKTNRESVREELVAYRAQLEQMIGLLDHRDFDGIRQLLEKGKTARSALLADRQPQEVV
jgi:prephenate dehydrogenase